MTEYWRYHYLENPVSEEFEDEEFDLDAVLDDIEKNPDGWEEV